MPMAPWGGATSPSLALAGLQEDARQEFHDRVVEEADQVVPEPSDHHEEQLVRLRGHIAPCPEVGPVLIVQLEDLVAPQTVPQPSHCPQR